MKLLSAPATFRSALAAMFFGIAACQSSEPVSPGGSDETTESTSVETIETAPAPSAALASATNLIGNGELEVGSSRPNGWSTATSGVFTPRFTYPATGRSGRGASVSRTLSSTGEARWQHTAVPVTAGAKYVYSVWYRSNASTVVRAEFRDSRGNRTYGSIANLSSSNNAWRQYTSELTIPSGKVSVSIFVGLARSGTLTIDDVSLFESTPTPPPPAAPTVTLAASPTSITAGQSSSITWSSTNATACTASGAWTGARGTAGSAVVTPSASGTYTLACTGAGGTASQSVAITVASAPPPPPPPAGFTEGMVSLTLDDSWESQYVNALPILQAANIKATFFFSTTMIEQGWFLFMTPAMVLDIAAKGHEIGGHTHTHPDLTTISADSVNKELTISKDYLQTLTGKAVTSFAYPYGNSNSTVQTLLQNTGYTSARTVVYSSQNLATTPKYSLFSMCIEPTNTVPVVKAAIDDAIANKRWFILCFHDVKLGGDNLSITPADFQEIVTYIKTRGIKVVTVAEGRALMTP